MYKKTWPFFTNFMYLRQTINENWQLTDYLEIIIIDLQKVLKAYHKTPNDEVMQWMLFLDNPEKKNEKILNTK